LERTNGSSVSLQKRKWRTPEGTGKSKGKYNYCLPLEGAKFLLVYKYALLPFVQVAIVSIGSPFASSDMAFVM
jgi:hypothetical protein